MTDFICTINEDSGGNFSSFTSWDAAIQSDMTASSSQVFAISEASVAVIANGTSVHDTGDNGNTATLVHAGTTQVYLLVTLGTFTSSSVLRKDDDTGLTIDLDDNGAQITRATAQLSNDSELTDDFSIDGWTTDSTHFIVLTTMTDQSFQDHTDKLTNKLDYDATKGAAVTAATNFVPTVNVTEGSTLIEKLQVKNTATKARTLASNALAVWKDLITTGLRDNGELVQPGATNTIINCLIINGTDGTGADGLLLKTDSHAFSCTVVKPSGGNGIGIASGSGVNSDAVNCCSFGYGTAWSGSDSNWDQANCSNNAGDETSGYIPGADSQDDLTFADQFESATDDWRAKDGSLDANGLADETNSPEDIVGTDRPASNTTIGCWEFVAAVSGALNLIMAPYRPA